MHNFQKLSGNDFHLSSREARNSLFRRCCSNWANNESLHSHASPETHLHDHSCLLKLWVLSKQPGRLPGDFYHLELRTLVLSLPAVNYAFCEQRNWKLGANSETSDAFLSSSINSWSAPKTVGSFGLSSERTSPNYDQGSPRAGQRLSSLWSKPSPRQSFPQ